MPPIYALWVVSLIVECGVIAGLVRRSWYRVYPKFFAYLIFDLTASLLLFWINLVYPATLHPFVYDVTWRVTQMLLVVGRILLVIESYQRLTTLPRYWRFSDGLVYPVAGLAAYTLHVSMTGFPLRWPDSTLESVFSLIGAGHALLGFSLIGILVTAHRQQLHQTVQFRHAQILCVYLLLTSACYYNAGQQPETVGSPLMLVATICYGSWFWSLIFSKEPARAPLSPEFAHIADS